MRLYTSSLPQTGHLPGVTISSPPPLQVTIDSSWTLINIELDGNAFLDIYNIPKKIFKTGQ
jgi:hypothetical protein